MAANHNHNQLVLVTGASGFIAGILVKHLLKQGYRVRATVRNKEDKKKNGHLIALAEELKGQLELVNADLMKDDGWSEAIHGCHGIFHTASPITTEQVEDEQILIRPAVDGTLRVLKAVAHYNAQLNQEHKQAADDGLNHGRINRVVLTSSVATLPKPADRAVNETEWVEEKDCHGYPKSKLLAEKAAWEFVNKLSEKEKFELVTVLPSLVLGESFGPSVSSSYVVQRMLLRVDPGCLAVAWGCVDVNDVAQIHIAAYEKPEAANKRFIASGKTLWHYEMADILAKEFNPKGYNVATWRIPYALIWMLSNCDKSLKLVIDDFGKSRQYDASKTTQILGIEFRDVEKALITTGYSLINEGLVPNKLPQQQQK